MKRVFRGLGRFIESKYRLLVILSILLIAPAIVGASQLQVETGISTFISSDSQIYQDYERFTERFSDSVLVVLITGDDISQLLTPANLAAMEGIEDELGAHSSAVSAVGPAFFIKQAMYAQTGIPSIPDDPQTLLYVVTDPATGEIRPEFAVAFPDNQHALIAVTLQGGLSPDEETEVVKAAREIVDGAAFEGVTTTVTGEPVIWSEVGNLMMSSMQDMLLVSIGLMLIILALIFTVRGCFVWRWLPLGIVFIAIIYAFGVMGVVSIPITMVTMAVFPIVIGLGIDYAIQLHNRYDEESQRGIGIKKAIINSVTHIGPAIGIAIIAACLGFSALFFSPVPMIQDFGLLLIIGVLACYILAVFFLLAILYWHDRRNHNRKPSVKGRLLAERAGFGVVLIASYIGIVAAVLATTPYFGDYQDLLIMGGIVALVLAMFSLGSVVYRRLRRRPKKSTGDVERDRMGFVEKAISRLAPAVIKNPAIILPIALALTVAGVVADGYIETETDETKFISQDVGVIADMFEMREISGGFTTANVLIEAEDVTDPQTLEWMLGIEGRIMSEQADVVMGTNSIASTVAQLAGGQIPQDAQQIKGILATLPPQITRNLVTEDYTAANLMATVEELGTDEVEEFLVDLEGYVLSPPPGISVAVTGMPLISKEMFNALTGGRMQITLIGIGLVFAGLLVLFRFRLLRALMATLPIALIIGWSSGVMYLMGIKYTPLTATLSALIIGIGVEFTILLMMRYYEERKRGDGPQKAMVTAMTKIGRAVIVSGLTTIGGFGALLIAKDFTILSDFGVVTMINIAFALISTLVVLPPLIVWVDLIREKRRMRKKRPRLAASRTRAG